MRSGLIRLLAVTGSLLAVAACGDVGGGGDAGANASVSGRVAGADFSFAPARPSAVFDARAPTQGELTVLLCEGGCPATGDSRAVTLHATGAVADLRSGGTFRIGSAASASARYSAEGQSHNADAVSGEIVVDSSDIRTGGLTVGTFSLAFADGSSASGFYEAAFTEVRGPVVQLLQRRR